MDSPKAKGSKKGIISKTWERCKSFSSKGSSSSSSSSGRSMIKSKSWPHSLAADSRKAKRVVPEGCFSIYVGPQRQRFVIKTEYVNHPLFRMLLEEAESEYGYSSEGPLALPCQVDHFIKLLMEMECDDEENNNYYYYYNVNYFKHKQGCNFVARTHTALSYHHISSP